MLAGRAVGKTASPGYCKGSDQGLVVGGPHLNVREPQQQKPVRASIVRPSRNAAQAVQRAAQRVSSLSQRADVGMQGVTSEGERVWECII